MLTLSLIAVSLAGLMRAQAPPPAPACYLLTTPEVATLVGSTNPRITTNTGAASTCIYENRGAMVTVVMVKLPTADAATERWAANKRVSEGRDVAGWPAPAYSATVDTAKDHAAIVGLVSSLTVVEVKAIDPAHPPADTAAKLQTAMKALAGRMAAQK
jgi:hypothetical protein